MQDKKKILIVDDDKFLLNMYSLKFERNGFEVKVAQGGEDAINILKDGFKPTVLLMDLIMPVMDGFEMYEKIKKDNLAVGAVAIMLTNQGLTSDINRAKELGVHGYIVKATTIPSEVVEEVIGICNANTK
ncbi:MAG: response regulator [Candidatus Paceibacterota bacterium]|jgi:two-component system alkaline phosphatase synthesis response regulator PhoP